MCLDAWSCVCDFHGNVRGREEVDDGTLREGVRVVRQRISGEAADNLVETRLG